MGSERANLSPQAATEGRGPHPDDQNSEDSPSAENQLLKLQRSAGNGAVSRSIQREGDGGGSWWDKAVGNYKKSNDIKDDPNQSSYESYKQWNDAATGRTQQAKEMKSLEGGWDKMNASNQKKSDDWVDKNTDKDSMWRSLGHGMNAFNRGASDLTEGLVVGGLGAGLGILNTVAHPLDAAMGVGEMAVGQLKPMGNLAGNLASTAMGDQTLEGTGKEYLKDQGETPAAKMIDPFVKDIAGDKKTGDEGGHYAKAAGRGLGMLGVGLLAGEVPGEVGPPGALASDAGALEGAATPKPTVVEPPVGVNPAEVPAAPVNPAEVPAAVNPAEVPAAVNPAEAPAPRVDPRVEPPSVPETPNPNGDFTEELNPHTQQEPNVSPQPARPFDPAEPPTVKNPPGHDLPAIKDPVAPRVDPRVEPAFDPDAAPDTSPEQVPDTRREIPLPPRRVDPRVEPAFDPDAAPDTTPEQVPDTRREVPLPPRAPVEEPVPSTEPGREIPIPEELQKVQQGYENQPVEITA